MFAVYFESLSPEKWGKFASPLRFGIIDSVQIYITYGAQVIKTFYLSSPQIKTKFAIMWHSFCALVASFGRVTHCYLRNFEYCWHIVKRYEMVRTTILRSTGVGIRYHPRDYRKTKLQASQPTAIDNI